jgi:hypothetical protein
MHFQTSSSTASKCIYKLASSQPPCVSLISHVVVVVVVVVVVYSYCTYSSKSMTGPDPPPPPGEPVRWRSSHLLPCIPADRRKKKREEKRGEIKMKMKKKDWPIRPPCLILAGTS